MELPTERDGIVDELMTIDSTRGTPATPATMETEQAENDPVFGSVWDNHAWDQGNFRPVQNENTVGLTKDTCNQAAEEAHNLNLEREQVKRREDPHLLTGNGCYVADIHLPDMLELAFVRSTFPHARLLSISYEHVEPLPGIHCVLTARQLAQEAPSTLKGVPKALAADRVRFFGEPVAAILADNRYLAEDAAELVEVEYEELPSVADVHAAIRDHAPLLHQDAPGNIAAVEKRSFGDFESSREQADIIIEETFTIHRAAAHPLETRGLVAAPDPVTQGLIVWAAHQGPHALRNALMNVLDLPAHKIRVVTPDVGGGFGQKNGLYPEDIVCCYLALKMQRPVRWIEDRGEHFISAAQEREQFHRVTLLAKNDGTLLGIRDHFYVDQGAWLLRGTTVPLRTVLTMPGPYRLQSYEGQATIVYTNKPPIGPYRGAGRPQGNFIMERMMDRLARRLNLDPVEVRKRNLITKDELPFDRGFVDHRNTPVVYDTGDFPLTLEKGLEISSYQAFRRQQHRAAPRRSRVVEGIGISCSVEDTGGGGYEGAMMRLEPGGRLVLYSGSAAQGQGHETIYARIAADVFGLQPQDVTVILGDTSHLTHGIGTFGSRSTAVAGGAVHRAASKLRETLLERASAALEASPEDLVLTRDRIHLAGAPERYCTLKELATLHTDLSSTDYFLPDGPTYANGVHICRCQIDLDLRQIELKEYYVVHDCGTLIEPALVAGQIHGGVLHGLSTALYEELLVDPSGQPVTTSYRDYLIPLSTDVPPMTLAHLETPSPLNPLGAKGAGEGGTIPALAAVANAVEDALLQAEKQGLIERAPVVRELPISPERLFRMIP